MVNEVPLERLQRQEDATERLEVAVDRLERALIGASEEGNKGIIVRVDKLEKQMLVLFFSFPLLVAGGAAIGTIISGFIGI